MQVVTEEAELRYTLGTHQVHMSYISWYAGGVRGRGASATSVHYRDPLRGIQTQECEREAAMGYQGREKRKQVSLVCKCILEYICRGTCQSCMPAAMRTNT